MAKYKIILFDQSTSTEYQQETEAPDEAEAIRLAVNATHTFICEMEDTQDPDGQAKILDDLLKRAPTAELVA